MSTSSQSTNVTSPVALSSSGVDATVPLAPADNSTISSITIPPTVSGPGGSSFELPASSYLGHLSLLDRAAIYSFKDHDVIEWARRYFLSIELVSVKITLTQTRGFGSTSTSPAFLPNYRYGIVPAGLPYKNSIGEQIVNRQPRLVSYAMNMFGSSSTTTFGSGGLPFPPGIQLDFKPVQFRSNYAEVFVGHNFDLPTEKVEAEGSTTAKPKYKTVYSVADIKELLHVQVDFVIRCSAPGFGFSD
jgi:hypothetical protein